DEEPGRLQPGEEVLLGARARGRRVDGAPERGAGRLLPAAPPGVLVLRPSRPTSRRPVPWCRDAQAVPTLDGHAGLADTEVVVPDPRPSCILPRERGDDVNVIWGVPDRNPAHRLVVAKTGQSGPVHDLFRDPCPLGIGENRIIRRGPDHAM